VLFLDAILLWREYACLVNFSGFMYLFIY
jgi:hypothetical protein